MPEQQDYYAVKKVSQSSIKTFLRSPEEYYYQYVQGGKMEDGGSSAMSLGTLMHTCLFEGEQYTKRYLVMDESKRPEPDKTFASTKNKLWRVEREHEAFMESKKIISAKDNATTDLMLSRILDHPFAAQLLVGEVKEGEIFHEMDISWIEGNTGLECKSKLDRVILNHEDATATIIDYKTTQSSNLEDFAWSIKKFGYEIQAAFYEDALLYWLRANGYIGYTVKMLFIPQKTSPPYHVLGVAEIGEERTTIARDIYKQAMVDIKAYSESGIWRKPDCIHQLFKSDSMSDYY